LSIHGFALALPGAGVEVFFEGEGEPRIDYPACGEARLFTLQYGTCLYRPVFDNA
jgi:hypothetical protein